MKHIKNTIAKIIGTSLGLGYMPIAPGTFGAIFGAIIYIILHHFIEVFDEIPTEIDFILLVSIGVFTLLGTWATETLKEEWGHDPSKIVMDETVGVWITMLFMPFTWMNVAIALVLFRFFDIAKPLGVGYIDNKMDNSLSVMLDDVLAGIYALICMQLLLKFVL